MWVRIGTVDGVKYLTKHFQVVIFSRDVNFEDFKNNCNQVQLIANYFKQMDIPVDGVYGQSQQYSESKKESGPQAKKPYR